MRLPIIASLVSLALACGDEGNPAGQDGGNEVHRLQVTPELVELAPGASATVSAVAFDTEGVIVQQPSLQWTSTTPEVATVSAAGVVSANAPGNTTVRVSTGAVTADVDVRVLPPEGVGSSIAIHPEVEYQRVTGWEGAAQIGESECNRQAFNIYRLPLIDRLVNELGVNRVRLQLRSGHENPVDWYTSFLSGTPGWQQHRYDSVNDNDDPRVALASGFQWSELDHKVDAILTPMRAALAARGERLYVNLNYADFGPAPFEHSSNPEEYAELIAETFKHLQSKYGWVPDAVELMLEPDNTQNWSGATLGAALVAAGERLAELGFHPAFIAPSTASMVKAAAYFDDMLAVPGVRDWLTDIAYHRYAGASSGALTNIRERAMAHGLRTGMLEHIGSGYQDLHQDLKEGRNSSWQQFALAFCDLDRGGAYYVIDQSNPGAPLITMGTRSRYLRHYFSFIRMDAVRVGATSGDSRFDPLAFRNTDGKLVVVIRATGSGTAELEGLPSGTYGVFRTTGSLTFASGPDVTVSGGAASFTMPAAGVMTIMQR
jgi:hypothetical protein